MANNRKYQVLRYLDHLKVWKHSEFASSNKLANKYLLQLKLKGYKAKKIKL